MTSEEDLGNKLVRIKNWLLYLNIIVGTVTFGVLLLLLLMGYTKYQT